MRPERRSPLRLRLGGFVPFSTVDFPGRLSAVIFCQGCPWRCRYCHNPHLRGFSGDLAGWERTESFLAIRRGLLDAVVFSGGEPSAQPALENAIRFVRGLGFQVALHTAGIFPDRLARVLPLVNWVGLDIKAPFDARYDTITGIEGSWRLAKSSLEIVLAGGIDYELRTTVHPRLLDARAKTDIERQLAGMSATPTRWQEFRPQGCADSELTEPPGA